MTSELLQQKADRARLLAAGASNPKIREEYLRLAEKLEAAAQGHGDVPEEELIRWPFR